MPSTAGRPGCPRGRAPTNRLTPLLPLVDQRGRLGAALRLPDASDDATCPPVPDHVLERILQRTTKREARYVAVDEHGHAERSSHTAPGVLDLVLTEHDALAVTRGVSSAEGSVERGSILGGGGHKDRRLRVYMGSWTLARTLVMRSCWLRRLRIRRRSGSSTIAMRRRWWGISCAEPAIRSSRAT